MLKDIEIWKNCKFLDPSLKNELSQLSEQALHEVFNDNISFGTGGIRGLMGVGTNRINYHTIVKATLGLANKLFKEYIDALDEILVVICYDTRINSRFFAETTAIVLAYRGIKVKLFCEPRPTPQLSFAIRHFKAQAGVMITASHNPPQYNGYKIYDQTGCQYVIKDANQLTSLMNSIGDHMDLVLPSLQSMTDKKIIEYIDTSFDEIYVSMIKSINYQKVINNNLTVVYSPLHGVGNSIGPRVLKDRNVNFKVVDEQMIQDGYFGKLSSVNPEDFKTYTEAIKIALKHDADLIMLTDPDGDRLGVAVNVGGEYTQLSGNQIAAIIVNYLINYGNINKGVLFTTIVSSNLGSKIALTNGLSVIKTLTGFKFIGEQIELLQATNKKFIFAYEESYGFLINDRVRDKDAFQAIWLLCEIASFYKSKKMNFIDVLNSIYRQYGYYYDQLLTFSLPSLNFNIEQIMDFLRKNDFAHWGPLKINCVYDYLSDSRNKDSYEACDLPKSNLIKYEFDNGGFIAFRPSGTEPKFKLYVSLVAEDKIKALANFNSIIIDVKKSLKQFNLTQ
jgi:phosphoglucomutase